jgi:hypothetical protein
LTARREHHDEGSRHDAALEEAGMTSMIDQPFTACLCVSLALWSSGVSAAELEVEAPVLGGTRAVSRALGLDPAPERARFMTELTRVVYDTPEGTNTATDIVLHKLTNYLESTEHLRTALAVAQPGGGSIALAMAGRKNDRNRLADFLDLVGLRLREKNKTYLVERIDKRQAPERLALLATLGIDPAQLAQRLNNGEVVRVDVRAETILVPLSVKLWSDAVFQRPVSAAGLFPAIMADRRGALLCHGLAALDDETLEFLSARPALVARLYEHDAATFAVFAGGLRVRQNRIIVPGGDGAIPLWEAVIDERLTQPERFVRELFGRDNGRVAYLYDALAQFDAPTRNFALGLWIKDARLRLERFRALLDTMDSFPGWAVPDRPFRRPTDDTVLLLTRVPVDASGAPQGPSWRVFWSRAFESIALPDDPARQLKNVKEDGSIDAAWLAQAVLAADLGARRERLDQLAFGLRVFSNPDERELPDALVAIRAFPRFRMLMLSLERMGIRNPGVYAAAAQHANRLSGLDASHGFIALSQFQGALALVVRLVGAHVLDIRQAEALVTSLSALLVNADGWYAGGVARWLQDSLGPTVGAGADGLDDAALVAALAGIRPEATAGRRLLSWEDRTYRLDFSTPEATRLTRVLEKLRAEPMSRAWSAEARAESLSADNLSVEEIQEATRGLKQLLTVFAQPQKEQGGKTEPLPPGVDPPKRRHDIVSGAIHDLSKITKPKDAKKAPDIARALHELVDDLCAESLLALTYALEVGDPQGTTLVAGNISRRHDFGFAEKNSDSRVRKPWAQPAPEVQAGVPWHIVGSLLGLDLGLSSLALRRVSTRALPEAPILGSAERDVFTKTVALLNVLELTDADRDAIADAIRRGQQRLAFLTAADGALDTLADEIGLDGWRRRAVRWSVTNDPQHVASFFSLAELLYLGKPPESANLSAWGVAADAYDGCVCIRLRRPGGWLLVIGRWPQGTVATEVADVNLRVALALADLKLPAALAKGVLAAAMQDYVDHVKPLHPDDWLTLVRSAQSISNERIQDYVAGLTANGPLIHDGSTGEVNNPQ